MLFMVKTGRDANLPYSLSRWTDVPAAKWLWFQAQLTQGWMTAFAQNEYLPDRWSLKPKDVLGLVFWTRDPTNLVRDRQMLRPYDVRIHMTLTGWEEVEKGAPTLDQGVELLRQVVQAFGVDRVRWRFSPIPLLPDEVVVDRFMKIATAAAGMGIHSSVLSFLQTNDRMAETRGTEAKVALLTKLAQAAADVGVAVGLCNEDRTLVGATSVANLASVVCAPPDDFSLPDRPRASSEGCGCVLMVDPFTINESCVFGCSYCYAADQELSGKKRNTTRSLPVLR
jgi:hypothetical protein